MNLYELTDSYQKILQLIEDGGEGLEDTLESITDAIEEKADGYGKVIKNIEAQIEAIKNEEKRLADRRKSLESSVKRLKDSLYESMKLTETKRIKSELFTFNIQNNPPSLNIENEDAIPFEYYQPQAPKLDKKELLNAIKNGLEIEGVSVKQGESLRIR